MIILALSIPFITLGIVSQIKENKKLIQQITLLGMLICLLIISINIIGIDNISNPGKIKEFSGYIFPNIDINIFNSTNNILGEKNNPLQIQVGIDSLSVFFVLLTAILLPIAYVSNWVSIKDQKTFSILMLLLDPLLLLIFLVLDVLGFYIFFESILAPMYILIGLYGSTNKEKAAYFLLIYTLAGSLIMLLGIATIYTITGTTQYDQLFNILFSIELQSILWIAIFASVMVKTPVFPIHTWLPVVHSESPLSGSILLAGIILKLAIFSCIRILIPILTEGTVLYIPLVYVIGVITIIYTSLATIRQMDVKVIIAYSSIGHMGTCLLGIFSNNVLGIDGSILLSICHGFVSPALFLCVGGILYDRYHVRIANYFQGLAVSMPIFMVYFFIFSLANIATPLSGNFLGEFLSLTGAFQRSPIFGFIGASSILLTAIYMMKFNSRINGGIKPKNLLVTYDLRERESFILATLLIPVIILGIMPGPFTNILSIGSESLIYSF